MRETCARVLAAALMTGAIGFALAMPAIFETAHKATGRSLTAPPSSLQRSVHVVASAPSLSARDGRLEGTQPIQTASFLPAGPSGSARNGNIPAAGRHSSKAGRSERAPKPAPKPTPAPAPATRELADTTTAAAVSPPAPSQPAANPGGKGKGKKKAKQHAKSKGKPTEAAQPPAAGTTPQPANESPAAEGEKDHGKGKDKDKGKGKSDDKGRDG
jgi:hypothetical protein